MDVRYVVIFHYVAAGNFFLQPCVRPICFLFASKQHWPRAESALSPGIYPAAG